MLGGGTKVRCGGIWAMVFGCDDGGGWSSRGVWVHLVWSDSVGWRSGAMIMEVWRRGIVWEKKDKKRILKNMGYTKHK